MVSFSGGGSNAAAYCSEELLGDEGFELMIFISTVGGIVFEYIL